MLYNKDHFAVRMESDKDVKQAEERDPDTQDVLTK